MEQRRQEREEAKLEEKAEQGGWKWELKELMPIVREGIMILVGPNMAQSQERDSVSGLPHVTIRRLSHGTPLGREINNVLREH